MCSVASLYLVILVLLTVIDTMFALFEAGNQVVGARPTPGFGFASLQPCSPSSRPGVRSSAPVQPHVSATPHVGLTVWHLSEVLPHLGLIVWHLFEVLSRLG